MKKLLLTLAIAAATQATMAQDQQPAYLSDPRYGATPEERTENAKLLSTFTYSFNLKDYPIASVELKELLQKIPAASENLYVRGVEIYKNFFANAKTEEDRKRFLDSIVIMYDLRAENFANHPQRGRDFVLTDKALTFNNFADDANRERVYKFFVDAIEAGKNNMGDDDVILVGTYFKNLTDSYKFDEITADDYLNRYENLSTILSSVKSDVATKIQAEVEAMFASSGAANCDNIEKIFKPQYEADPNNTELVKKILALFSRAKCATDFQMHLLEKYYQADPKPEIALMLAGVYEEKKDFAKAFEYINIAIDGEKDPAIKTSHLLRAALQSMQMNNFREAASFARRTLDIDPNNSQAAFLYASALMSGVNGCGENRQYAYWLVADAFNNALRLMGQDDPSRADVQSILGSLYGNFPKKTDLFMLGLEEGQGYTVNCGWVSGRTTVRGR